MATVTAGSAGNLSSFGVVNEAEQQLLQSEAEEKKIQKSSVQYKQKALEKYHEQKIDNLQERLKALAGGHGGCIKFLKVISFVAMAIAAPITGGASLALEGAALAAMTIATAALTAIGKITDALIQLEEAMKDKKLILNQAEGLQIMAIIDETKKWIEDSKSQLKEAGEREQESFDEFYQMLQNLEASFQTMLNA